MEKGWIQIKTTYGNLSAYLDDNRVLIGNKDVKCTCKGKIQSIAPVFKLQNKTLVCPACGRTLSIIELPSEIEARNRAEIMLVERGVTEDFGVVYSLSAHVDRPTWNKISKYFILLDENSEAGGDADFDMLGWVVTRSRAEAVEEILNIEPARKLAVREARYQESIKKENSERQHDMQIIAIEIQEIQQQYQPIFADWSWDDYSQQVGTKVKEFSNFDVYEYLVNDSRVGYTLKRKNLAEKWQIPAIVWTNPLHLPSQSDAMKSFETIGD